MSTKYKFIAILPDEVEIDSEYDVEGKVIWPSYSQSQPIRLKGIFDSYEEAKAAADKFKAYDAIVYNDCGGGYIEELHSFYCDDEPIVFVSPDEADEWIRVRLERIADNEYDEYDENDESENEEEEEQEKFAFEEIEILEIQIVEIEK